MPNKALIQALDGTPPQISFADHAGDFSPATTGTLEVGTPTDVQLATASLAAAAARQSAKFDFGEHRADLYHIRGAIEFATSIAAGKLIDLYLGPSGVSTAANGNLGNLSGSDAAYTGYSSNLTDSLRHLLPIGRFVTTAQATTTVQYMYGGLFSPPARYGSLVVVNGAAVAFHSDDVEIHIVFDPVIPELQ